MYSIEMCPCNIYNYKQVYSIYLLRQRIRDYLFGTLSGYVKNPSSNQVKNQQQSKHIHIHCYYSGI